MKSYFLYILLFVGCWSCKKVNTGYTSKLIQLPTDLDLNDICFINTDTGFVAGGSFFGKGILFRTNDGGETWDSIVASSFGINSIDYQNGQLSYCESGQKFYRSSNLQSWSTGYALGWWQWHQHIKLYDGRAIVVGGENFGKGFIHIQEQNHALLALKDTFEHAIRDIAYTSNRNLYAVGYGLVMKSTDEGHSWQRMALTGDFFKGVDFVNNNVGYIVGEHGTVLKTTNQGVSWQNVRAGTSIFANSNKLFTDIAFVNEDLGFIVGTNNLVLCTNNGGKSWHQINDLDGVATYNRIRIFNQKAYLAGNSGQLLRIDLE